MRVLVPPLLIAEAAVAVIFFNTGNKISTVFNSKTELAIEIGVKLVMSQPL